MRLVYRMSVQESYRLDDVSKAMRCADDGHTPFKTPAWPWRCSQAHCKVLPSLKSRTTLLGNSCRS